MGEPGRNIGGSCGGPCVHQVRAAVLRDDVEFDPGLGVEERAGGVFRDGEENQSVAMSEAKGLGWPEASEIRMGRIATAEGDAPGKGLLAQRGPFQVFRQAL